VAAERSFQWDDANRGHIGRHRVTPQEFEQAMANDPIEVAEYTVAGEPRVQVVGMTDAGRLLEMVYTIRRGRIRAVTAFPMKRNKRRFYYGSFPKKSD
jgi:uncharacterized DUF497 family protein